MDMAIEHESNERRLTHVAASIPMHFIPKGTAGALPIIEAGVEAMKLKLREQSEQIANLQLRCADMVHVERALRPTMSVFDCGVAHAASKLVEWHHEATQQKRETEQSAPMIDLENRPLADLIVAVQAHLEQDTALELEADGVWVLFDGTSYQATHEDAKELLGAVGLLARTAIRG